uniref:Uncharacterized protein n=1 Tax=Anguilla anguilla TaxID=7936 RepID=A0A0E9SS12_ANGAN
MFSLKQGSVRLLFLFFLVRILGLLLFLM